MANSNEYMREYMQKRRATRRQQLMDLLGKKCWNCGGAFTVRPTGRTPDSESGNRSSNL